MPNSKSSIPIASCNRCSGTRSSKGPSATTMRASTRRPANAPSPAGRQPRTVATASTIVSASTASTNEARNAVVIAGPMCAKLSVMRTIRLADRTIASRAEANADVKNRKSNRLSNKNEFKLWEYDLAEARTRNPNPASHVLPATPSGRHPLASPAWQRLCCNKSWLSFDSKTLFSGSPRPIALNFESSAPPCVFAMQAAAADCSAMIHNVRGAGFVKLPDFVRTTIFRWTSIAFAACILLFSAFVFWEAAADMLARMDAAIVEESLVIAADAPDRQLNAIEDRLSEDPRRIKLAGLFRADGHRITGNLESVPQGLAVNATVQNARVVRVDQPGQEGTEVRAIARSLPNGNVLGIARHNGELTELAEAGARALLVALPFAFGLSLAIGAILSVRVQRRVTDLNALVRRIMSGNLSERVPVSGLDHPFDKLAEIANGMLDEIEVLVTEMAGGGNEIAHDLRTPLTRVRIGLERGRANAKSLEELQSVPDRAIGALDQSLAVVTALLRITEIENSRGKGGFAQVALADPVRVVGDLSYPIAEVHDVTLRVASVGNATAYCDRDLLFEA